MKQLIFILFLVLFTCKSDSRLESLNQEYKEELTIYFKELKEGRINYLKLIGLYKLSEGINTFGKSVDNTISIPAKISYKIGNITKNESVLQIIINEDVLVTTEKGESVSAENIKLDNNGSSKKFYHNSIYWQVITRSGNLYLRVWDNSNPIVKSFKGFKKYNLNKDFLIKAGFLYYDNKKNEEIETQLGVNTTTYFIGKLTFKHKGKMHSLDVGENGFIMVRDHTSGFETYGGGRYFYIELPEKNGEILVDFNKLYNPPCAFSQFTTCALPPKQNKLPFKLEAGEQYARNK